MRADVMSECHEGQDVLIRISSGTFVPPCDFLPEPIRRFLRKCWHVKPSRRVSEHDRRAQRVGESAPLANSLTAVDPELHSQTSSTGGSSIAPSATTMPQSDWVAQLGHFGNH